MTTESEISLAFVGTVVPDQPEYKTAAFSPAGQMFQFNLLTGLKKRGFRPEAFVCLPIPAFPKGKRTWVSGEKTRVDSDCQLHLVPFVNLPIIKQLMIGIGVFLRLVAWGFRNRGNKRVMLTYNLSVPPGLFTLLAAKLTRTIVIAALCDINVPGSIVPNTMLTRLDFWLHHRLAPHFDGFIAVSEATIRDFCFGRPVVRIEGGLSEQALTHFHTVTANDLSNQDSADHEFKVAMAGTLNETNGVLRILEALDKLPANFRIFLAGAGPLADRVSEKAAVDPRLVYLGALPFAKVLDLYSSVDLLLNVRITESIDTRYFFPSKLLECMGSGTPVASTKTGHVESEYGPYLYLLEDDSTECLVNTLQSIAKIDRRERQRKAAAAQAYMFGEKTWERQSEKAALMIRNCLGDKEPR